MNLLAHDRVWLAQSRAGIQQIVWNEENVENYRRTGWDVEGPYVPEAASAGAVTARDELRAGLAMAAAALEHAGYRDSAASARATIARQRQRGGQYQAIEDRPVEAENERYRRALEEIGAPGGPLNLLEPNQGEQPAPTCAAVELHRILETALATDEKEANRAD